MTTTSNTPKVTIKNFTSDSTKVDEISVLEQIAESMPSGSYLRDFFSNPLVSWVSEQIRNDFPADLMDWYRQEEKRSQNEQSNRLAVEHQLANLKDKMEKEQVAQAEFEARVEERIARQNKQNEQLAAGYQELYDRIAALEEERDAANRKVIELKVKLFDIQNPD